MATQITMVRIFSDNPVWNVMETMTNNEIAYRYLGDRLTLPQLKGRTCHAIRRHDGKCIRGRNGSMLVSFGGEKHVVIGRLLRKTFQA
jgi:hypothetical protein